MQGNLNPSARVALAETIPPAQAGVGTITSGWVNMAKFHSLLAVVNVGLIGAAGTIDAKIEQATTDAGTGAKAAPGLAAAQLLKAGGDNRQVVINVRPEDIDKNGGFKFVRLSVTIGGAATALSAVLLGLDPRYGSAAANQITTVAETVS